MRVLRGVNIWSGLASMLLWQLGCTRGPDPRQVAEARQVLQAYLEAWERGDYRRMFELSTRRRIHELTDVDPAMGSAYRARALERFALVAEQTKRYMGYVGFQVEGVVASRGDLVVFRVVPRDEQGRRADALSFRVVRRDGAWKVD